MDTRAGTGTGGHIAQLAPGATLKVPISGVNGIVANGTTATLLNLTATGATAGGWLVAYPDGAPQPSASALNYATGQTVSNTSIVPVGADCMIDIVNGGSHPVDVLVDMSGTFFTYPSS